MAIAVLRPDAFRVRYRIGGSVGVIGQRIGQRLRMRCVFIRSNGARPQDICVILPQLGHSFPRLDRFDQYAVQSMVAYILPLTDVLAVGIVGNACRRGLRFFILRKGECAVIADGIRALCHAILRIQIKPMGPHAGFRGIGRQPDGKDVRFSILIGIAFFNGLDRRGAGNRIRARCIGFHIGIGLFPCRRHGEKHPIGGQVIFIASIGI